MRDLADALGLEGEITRDGTEWRVSDGSGTLAVADGGTATWWYSSPPSGAVTGSGSSSGSAGCAAGEECTTVTATAPCPADGDCAIAPTTSTTIACGPGADCVDPDCAVSSDGSTSCPDVEQPYPPADLPSGDEARDIALDLLAATGVDLDRSRGRRRRSLRRVVRDRRAAHRWGSVRAGGGRDRRVRRHGQGCHRQPGRGRAPGRLPLLDTRATIDRANSQRRAPTPSRPPRATRISRDGSDEPVTTDRPPPPIPPVQGAAGRVRDLRDRPRRRAACADGAGGRRPRLRSCPTCPSAHRRRRRSTSRSARRRSIDCTAAP